MAYSPFDQVAVGLRALHRLIRTLILPSNAAPNDAAIVIGPDVPPCMQSQYFAIIMMRPTGTVSNTIDRPTKYIGLVKNVVSGQVDEGFLLWDQKTPATVCGYYAYKTTFAALAPAGSGNSVVQEFYGQEAQGGAATMSNGGTTQFGGAGWNNQNKPWSVAIGDGDPSLAPFSIDGKDAPRGIIASACSTGDSAAIGAETVILTLPSATYYNQRAFEIKVKAAYTATVGGGFGLFLVRRGTTTAGVAVAEWEMPSQPGGVANCGTFTQELTNTSGGNITQQMCLTFIQSAGTGTVIDGSPFGPYYVEVRDIGASANYPDRDGI